MKTPHKHAALIKAWADGAEIQFLDADDGDGQREWLSTPEPSWRAEKEYRIRPADKFQVLA